MNAARQLKLGYSEYEYLDAAGRRCGTVTYWLEEFDYDGTARAPSG